LVCAQGVNDGAWSRRRSVFTFEEQHREHSFHLFERHDFLANIRESVAGNLADGVSTAALLEAQELTNFIEGKTQIQLALRTA
jgi:hypothetical protein